MRFLTFFLIVTFFGARIAFPLVGRRPTPTHILIGATTGIAVYSFYMTVVGFAGGLQYSLAWTLAIFHIVLFWRLVYWWKWTKFKSEKLDWSSWRPPDIQSRIIFWLLIIYQLVMLINAVAPFINTDSETYHYLFLKNYIADGHISTLSWSAYSYYPQAMELAVIVPFTMAHEHGPEAANICFWLMQLALIWWLIDFCARRGKARVGYFLAAAVSGIFYWPVIAYSGDIDGAVALFSLAGVFTYFDWLQRRDKPIDVTNPPKNSFLKTFWVWQQMGFTQLVLAGLFLGTACASKYSVLLLALIVLIHLLWILMVDNRTRKRTFASALGFIIFLAIPVLPWFVRNFVETGNPVFPFFRGIFGGPELTLADDVNTWATWGGIGISVKNYLLYPFKLALYYKLQPPYDFIRVPYSYMSWLFALAPIASLFLLHRRIERIAAIWCLVFFSAVFFVMNSQTRYFLPFTILALWLVVEWLDALASNKPATELFGEPNQKKKPGWLAWAVFVIVLIPFLTQIDLVRNHFIQRWPYIGGQLTRAEYEEKVWPSAKVFEKANELSSEDEKVCIFSLRAYRLDGDYILPTEEMFSVNEYRHVEYDFSKYDISYILVETRIRKAAALINLMLRWSDPDEAESKFDETFLLYGGRSLGLSRELVREFIKTLGGKRSVSEYGKPHWSFDLSRFRKPGVEGMIIFLGNLTEQRLGNSPQFIETTSSWELYNVRRGGGHGMPVNGVPREGYLNQFE